jgi:hypothetical protein
MSGVAMWQKTRRGVPIREAGCFAYFYRKKSV